MAELGFPISTSFLVGPKATPSNYTYDIVINPMTTAANNVVVGKVISVIPRSPPPPDAKLVEVGDTLAVVPGATVKTIPIPSVTISASSASSPPSTESQTLTTSNPTNVVTTTGQPQTVTASSSSAKGSSTSIATPSSDNNNVGPIVGAAIGCLIAGALIGFIVGFLFYKRQSRGSPSHSPPPVIAGSGDEKKAFDTMHSPTAVDDKLSLSKFLLDSSPDKEIAAELRSLGTLIQQHVENNYHLQPLQADSHALAVSLSQLGIGGVGGPDPEVVAQLALDPRTRQVALQHVISQVVFTSIDVSSRSQLSMLPAPIAAFLQSIPPQESGEKNHEVLSIALNQWRALAAFILHPARSQRTPLPTSNAAVGPQAARLADALDNFLSCFVMPGDEHSRFQQKNHLQAVITECTKLGYVLLSQPSEWRFVHSSGTSQRADYGGRSRVLVICAGFVKATQKDGTPYNPPIQVVAPTTVPI